MKDPASALGERVANGLIENEAWARDRLRAHAGRTFLLRSGPLATTFSVRDDGTLEAIPALGTTPDLELRPLAARRCRRCWPIRSAGKRWSPAPGDAALAATLRELAMTLPWFVERGLRPRVRTDRRATARRHRPGAARISRVRERPAGRERLQLRARRDRRCWRAGTRRGTFAPTRRVGERVDRARRTPLDASGSAG